MTTRQLIVLGGGGFLMETSRALDAYFLRATGKPNPRVCFVGTASGDAESARYKFYEAMSALDCRATHLSLVQPPTADLASFVLEQDALYVGEAERRPAFHRLLAEGQVPEGYAADDGAALHYVDEALALCVASRPAARVYRVARDAGSVTETPVPCRLLG